MSDPIADRPEAPPTRRGIRLQRLRLAGVTRPYDVDFRFPDGSFRPLSVIAGRTNTGKTSVLQFIAYALGGSYYPDHEEIVRQVRAALLEVVLPGGVATIERGIESKFALLFDQPLDRAGETVPQPHPIEPTSDAASLSRMLLTTVDLQDVQLPEAPAKSETDTQTLSFRDLMWLCMVLNERVGSSQLLFEGNHAKNRKLQQVVDAVFNVHQADGADLAGRIKKLNDDLTNARRDLAALEGFVREQGAVSQEQLQGVLDDAEGEMAAVRDALRRLDASESAAADMAVELRRRHQQAAREAIRARQLVRDREALVSRYASLRAQYNDDIRKLTLLKQAESIFDQLSVQVCPACLGKLPAPPTVRGSTCSLCAQPLAGPVTSLTLGVAAASRETAVAGFRQQGTSSPSDHKPATADASAEDNGHASREDANARAAVTAELASTRRRLKELNEYWAELNDSLPALRESSERADENEASLAAQVDRAASGTVAPFTVAREELLARRQDAIVRRDRANSSMKQWRGIEVRRRRITRMAGELADLRAEARGQKTRPDRSAMIAALGARFRQILSDVGYPKHDNTGSVDGRFVPSVRDRPYTSASSGGQVLQTLAWILAIFEVAYEQGGNHPGFLLIDSPQKNLGGSAKDDDKEFADVTLVERLYGHIINWLEGEGRGAQIIIVDNTPPPIVTPFIVEEFTRNPDRGRFGLIDNEVG
ncbi:hypothetical protein AWW66_06950 [Micromonospora rosaria]|uniref:Rad50/SbcC-type AAA domain-containing protein n=1 Tax=Micromonospora rosaria TaxID=47874 RepID=A0A136PVZ8_9ACTN|nr:hypothetical protein [Micromonospora rosaria]KXK62658.1 hypothetical protein AWW66_06950 [Micromonospora rosaria]